MRKLPAPATRFLARSGHAAKPRRARWWLWTLVLAVLLGAGWGIRRFTRTVDAPVTWSPYLVERGDLRITISAAGTVSPQNRIELRPPLSGRIDAILVREGDTITKGQVLAWISSADRAAVMDAARAAGSEEIKRWEDAYKPTPLVAPLPGFIIARRAEPGQTVNSGDSPLVMADRLIVRAQVDETDLGKVRVGLPCEVKLDAYPEVRMRGRVDHIAYEARNVNNVTVYDIEVALRGSAGVMRSGMTATVSVIVAERERALLVPAEALVDQDGQLGVMVPRPGNALPVLAPIKFGLQEGGQVEITAGLKEGATIMISSVAVPPSRLTDAKNPFMTGGTRQRGGTGGGGQRGAWSGGTRGGGGGGGGGRRQ